MAHPVQLFRWEDLPLVKITEMVACKAVESTFATLTQTYLKKGAVVPLHARETDTTIYVLQGALRVRLEPGDEVIAREGEVVVVSAGVRYETESLDDVFVLTVTATDKSLSPPSKPATRSP